uniref:PICA n=1 Tax=Brugia pahangi TaxID=6280 RepID=A0A0N4TEJ6_BRUPA
LHDFHPFLVFFFPQNFHSLFFINHHFLPKRSSTTAVGFNPFLTNNIVDSSAPPVSRQWPVSCEETDKQWSGKTSQDAIPPQHWSSAVSRSDLEGGSATAPSWSKNGESSESDEAVGATGTDISNVPQQPSEMVNSALRNPFGAMQQNAQALHTAGVSATVITPQQPDIPAFGAPPSGASSANVSPVHFGMTTQAPPPPPPPPSAVIPNQNLTIYEQTPFSLHTAGVSATVITPQQPDIPAFGAPPSGASSGLFISSKSSLIFASFA